MTTLPQGKPGNRRRASRYKAWRPLALLLLVGLCPPAFGGTDAAATANVAAPQPTVAASIRVYAARHVEHGQTMKTELVVGLFDSNRERLTSEQIASLYEAEYARLKQQDTPGPLDSLIPNAGSLTVLLLALLLFFHSVLKNLSGRLVKTLGDGIYQRLAGLRLFRRTALRRYRRNIEANYHEIKIPFRQNRPLPMAEVFVPLKVAGSLDAEQINADDALREFPRLMVTGPPGSGKSKTLFEGKRGPKPTAVAEYREPERLHSEIGKLKMELDWLKKKSGMSL